MAADFINELNAVTHGNFRGVLYENIWKSNPTFIKLKSVEELIEGGGNMNEDVALVANPNATSYTGLGPLPVGYNQEVFKATSDWSQYNISITLPGMLIEANQGTEQIINIVSGKVALAERALRDYMGNDLMSYNAAIPGWNGLLAGFDDGTTTTTYAGLSRTTYANWKGNLLGNSGTTRPWTNQLMNQGYQAARIDSASPKLAAMTQGLFNKQWINTLPIQRFEDPEIAKLGFPNMMFNTAMCYVDSKVPTTVSGVTNESILFINLDSVKLKTFRRKNFAFIEFRDSSDQDGVIGHIRVYLQDIVVEPRLNSHATDMDSTL